MWDRTIEYGHMYKGKGPKRAGVPCGKHNLLFFFRETTEFGMVTDVESDEEALSLLISIGVAIRK